MHAAGANVARGGRARDSSRKPPRPRPAEAQRRPTLRPSYRAPGRRPATGRPLNPRRLPSATPRLVPCL